MGMHALSSTRDVALALAFFLSLLLGARAFAAEQATAVLARVSGSPIVYELSAGKPRQVSSVSQGKQYKLPIEIETGANDSATFALVNSVIEVSPNSLMRIVAPESRDVGVVQRVLQQAGSSLFRVHRGTMDRFQVETPFLVSVVKGTVFHVLVRDDGATVSLQEGRLQVNSLDAQQTVDLAPGDVAFAGRDGALKMLKVEVTAAGARTRETIATRSDPGVGAADVPVDALADVTHGIVRDVVPPSGVVSGALPGTSSVTAPFVATVSATVSPVVAGVAVPVANVVEPVTENLVAPVVSNVVAPAVNTVVSNVVAPAVNTVVAPVINTVVAPAIGSAVSPVVNTVVAPVVTNVVAPVVNTAVAPVIAPVVAPMVPVVAPVAAPVIVVATPVVAPVVTPVVAPVAPVVAPITNLLGFHH